MDKKDIVLAVDEKCAGTIMDASEKGLAETPLKPSNTITSKAAYHLSSLSTRLATGLTFICLTVVAIHYFAPAATTFPSVNLNFFPWDPPTCPAPKPNVFGYHPPRPSNEEIVKTTKGLDDWLTKTVAQKPIDSLSIAVVTAAGPLFQKGYGVLRANESLEGQKPVDGNSVYRIASISKMFTVLETLILRERGVLNWYANNNDLYQFSAESPSTGTIQSTNICLILLPRLMDGQGTSTVPPTPPTSNPRRSHYVN